MDYENRAREIIDAASASEGVIREVDYDLALEAIDEALRESYEAGRADNEADTSAALRSIAPGDAVIVGGYSCVPETWLRESYEAGLEAAAGISAYEDDDPYPWWDGWNAEDAIREYREKIRALKGCGDDTPLG